MKNLKRYSWNPVFNFIMQLKQETISKFNTISYEPKEITNEFGGTKLLSCVENWAYMLQNSEYIKRLAPIQINQNGNLVLFRYANHSSVKEGEVETSPFKEDFWELYEGFYKECRSLVIDVKNDNIVIAPFKKFMNLNQTEEYSLTNIQNKIDEAIRTHKPVEISTKLDGSMQCATWYEDSIVMSGAQAIDINKSWRLYDGFGRLVNNNNLILMLKNNPFLTFIFEYISLRDAHVVTYSKEQEGLYLIGIRDNKTGRQWFYKEILALAQKYNVNQTTNLHKETLQEVLNNLDKYKSSEAEGVVLNVDGFLVKIKYNDYVKCHKLLSTISSPNLIIEAYADGWVDDLIAKVPLEYRWRIQGLVDILNKHEKRMINTIESNYQKIIKKSNNEISSFMKEVQLFPKTERKFLIQKYKNQPINFFKRGSCTKTPHYLTLSEIGLSEEYEKMLKKHLQ